MVVIDLITELFTFLFIFLRRFMFFVVWVMVMSLRDHISEEEIKKIGLRLKSCRVLTGFTQEQFAETFKIPYTTIRSWEYGRVVPRRHGVQEFVVLLKECGVFVESDWILSGYGPGPSFHLKQPSFDVTSNEIEAFKFNSKNKGFNPVVTSITDEAMFPWFCIGDRVGGTLIDPSGFEGIVRSKLSNGRFPVLVRLDNGHFVPRWPRILDEKIVFSSNNAVLEQANTLSVALINWHEVKYPRSLCDS
jgi:transcriptional regulator with XRE-family HTH domain